MKIREAIQSAAEAVLTELLVPNAAKELARQIGERAERHVIGAITGDDSTSSHTKARVRPGPKTKAKKTVPRAKRKATEGARAADTVGTSNAGNAEAKGVRRRKPRKRTNGHEETVVPESGVAPEASLATGVPGNVVPINGAAGGADGSSAVQTAEGSGLGL